MQREHLWEKDYHCNIHNFEVRIDVATLTLGSQPRKRFTKVWAKSEAQESDFMFPRV
jgi:hypothetical protein